MPPRSPRTAHLFLAAISLTTSCIAESPGHDAERSLTQRASVSPNVVTQHYDNARTGANLSEAYLSPQTVTPSKFGKLFELPVDADVYAQPLYVSGLTLPNDPTPHNVLFIATMNNSLYAFDADSYRGGEPLWRLGPETFGRAVPVFSGSCVQVDPQDITGSIGILSTPVIDLASQTIYLVSRSFSGNDASVGSQCVSQNYHQRIFAIDIRTGRTKIGPVEIAATVPGNGAGSVGGNLSFQPEHQNQRPGLLLQAGVLYIAWGGHNDRWDYHGWVMGYDASTLAQVGVFNTTPNGAPGGGIWHAGGGLAGDGQNVYFVTGNGDFNPSAGNYGDSVMKLRPAGSGFTVSSYFTPWDQDTLSAQDKDLGSTSVLLFQAAGRSYAMAGSKVGYAYLMDTADLGGFHATDQVLQKLAVAVDPSVTCPDSDPNWGICHHIHGQIAYLNGSAGPTIYVWPEKEPLRSFRMVDGQFVPFASSPLALPLGQMPGAFLSLSANGQSNGVLWATHPINGDAAASGARVPGIVRAFDAEDVRRELWNSEMIAARDGLGNYPKFNVPTVANGKLYMPTLSNRVVVYGALGDSWPTLLHRWSFTQDGTDSVGGKNASLLGGATIAGGTAVLNGNGAYVSLPIASTLQGLSSATFEAWTTSDAANAVWSRIFDFGSSAQSYLFLTAQSGATASPRFAIATAGNGAETVVDGASPLRPGRPTHVAVTIDGTTGITSLYVDGAQVASRGTSTLSPQSLGATGNDWLGRSQFAADPYFNGTISEFRVYKGALSPNAVRDSFQRGADWGLSTAQPRLRHRWSFSSDGADSVGGATAAAAGGAVFAGGAAVLNGAGAYVDLPIGSTIAQLSSATFETWVQWNGPGTKQAWARIFDFGTGTLANMFLTPDNGASGTTRFAISTNGTGGETRVDAPAMLPSGRLTHVAVTVDGAAGVATLFVDGVRAGVVGGVTLRPSSLATTTNNWLGRSQYAGDPFYNGSISELRIYDGALSRDAVYRSFVRGPDAGIARLVHRWSFTEDGVDSVGGATALFHGASVGSGAALLDGNGAYVDLPLGPTIAGLSSGAFEAWVTWSSTAGQPWSRIFDFGNGTQQNLFLTPSAGDTGTPRFAITTSGNGGETRATAPSAMAAATSVHIVASVDDATRTSSLYVNGARVAGPIPSSLLPSQVGFTENNWLGRSQYAADPFFKGSIHELRIYDGALGDAAVGASFSSGPGARMPRLVHRWSFAGSAADSVGGATGTLAGGATISAGAVSLNGADGYVSLPIGSTIARLASTTFETWVTVHDTTTRWTRIFDFGSGPATNMFLTAANGGGTNQVTQGSPRFAITAGGVETQVTSAGGFAADQPTHFAVTIDAASATVVLYMNGRPVKVVSGVAFTPQSLGATVNNWLGRSQYADPYLNGSISEFRIYDAALSRDEVSASFAAGPDSLQ
jgi:hypothetical protein